MRLPKNSFWYFQIGGWLIYFVVIYITFLSVAAEGNFLRLMYIKGFRALVGFALSLVLWQFYRRIIHRVPTVLMLAMAVAAAVVLGFTWTVIDNLFAWQNAPTLYDIHASSARAPRVALDYSMTLLAWSAIYFGIKYWQRWQTESQTALESTAQAQKAQLEMLRYQLNPHFLFNALNSIRASVDEDQNRAKQMITQLSEFLRYSLVNETARKIPLSEEIDALRNYLAIEKIRFEDKLQVEFQVEPRAEGLEVPCFLLNPLVENAIKHGLRTGARPVTIRVSAAVKGGDLVMEVANSGRLLDGAGSNGTGIGLRNVRERLANLYGDRARFDLREQGGLVNARIEIPASNQ